ncbi:kinase-like domain-containing protein [Dipodascopsis tothii]|uniref:kinase-like domain-containing protein n=1 Tax=Dipodascopsis tothii TaxID=44089 RepID=UPI0034CD5A7E
MDVLRKLLVQSPAKLSQLATQALLPVDEMTDVVLGEDGVATLVATTPAGVRALAIGRDRPVVVGRRPGCDEVVAHAAASSVHFEIYVVVFDDAHAPLVYCRDLSRNGTFHNDRVIGRNRSVLLVSGDRIVSFRFFQHGAAAEPDSVLDEDRTALGRYDVVDRVIGRGTFGRVYLAVDRVQRRQVACKVIETGGRPARAIKARTEVAILRRLNHPNVIGVHETFAIRDRIYIFEDLITGGDLFSYLVRGDVLHALGETETMVIVWQVLKALEYLHTNDVVHRDLKLDNILLVSASPGTRVVLVDFGISKCMRGVRRMNTVVGTPEFSAPEVGFGEPGARRTEYDAKCDLWSLGVVLHILLSAVSPFYDPSENGARMAARARAGRLHLTDGPWDAVSEPAKDLVRRLLCVQPAKRYSIEDCYAHPWLAAHAADLDHVYNTNIVRDWAERRTL